VAQNYPLGAQRGAVFIKFGRDKAAPIERETTTKRKIKIEIFGMFLKNFQKVGKEKEPSQREKWGVQYARDIYFKRS